MQYHVQMCFKTAYNPKMYIVFMYWQQIMQ